MSGGLLALALGAVLIGPARAEPLAWSWPADGVMMSLEGTLRFDDPLALTLEKYPPMVDAVTAVARVHCVSDGRSPAKALRCRVQDARMKAVTSPAYWSDVDRVLQSLQASIEGSEITLKVEADGHIKRVKGPDFEGDRQTGALHDALTSALFWSLDLSLPGEDAPSWIQKANLLNLPLAVEHAPNSAAEDGAAVTLRGDGDGAAVEGSYLFDTSRGLLLESALVAEVTAAASSLVSLDAYTVSPRSWESRMSFVKIGAAREILP